MSGRVTLASAPDTRELGARLGRLLRAGDLVVLDGPLGAGKTTFAQGVGAGMGVSGAIASPTFVIARVHRGPVPLVHVDAYRLGSVAEIDDLDLDFSADRSATLVEWGAGRVEELADAHLTVHLERSPDPDDDTRTVWFEPAGGDWAARIAAVLAAD